MTEEITKFLLGMGLQGLVMLALGFVCIRLDKRNQDQQTARIAEGKENLVALNRATDAQERHTAALVALTELVRTLTR